MSGRLRKHAIVMISIGDRPWVTGSAETFRLYCQRIGADFYLVTEFPSPLEFAFPALPERPGRPNKKAYACKTYFAWKFLAEFHYERVVVVDDSCCVRVSSPNIFDLIPQGCCGFTTTNEKHAMMSFKSIAKFIAAKNLPEIEYNPEFYMNSGVVLYDAAFARAMHKERIIAAADLLFAKYPHQTLTYYLLMTAQVDMQKLPKSFNSIPALNIDKQERINLTDIADHMQDHVNIFHITGGFKHRGALISQIAERLLAEHSAGLPDPALP